MMFAISVSPFTEADNLNPDSWLYVAMFRYPQELGGMGGSRLDGGSAWGVGGFVRVQEPMLPMLDKYKTQHLTVHALFQVHVTFFLPSFRLIDNSQRSIHDQAVHSFLQLISS